MRGDFLQSRSIDWTFVQCGGESCLPSTKRAMLHLQIVGVSRTKTTQRVFVCFWVVFGGGLLALAAYVLFGRDYPEQPASAMTSLYLFRVL